MRGIRKSNRGGEYDQSILYTCMEISQWNPHIMLLICTTNKITLSI
jgi:hypothetical protein